MKYFLLQDFKDEVFKNFLDFVNKWDHEEEIHIILNSDGGNVSIGETITNIINSFPKKFSVSSSMANSAAFKMLYELECPVELYKTGIYMIHKSSWAVKLMDGSLAHGEFEKFQVEQLGKIKQNTSFLTNKELEDYNNGKDIYMDKERVQEVFESLGKKFNKVTKRYNDNETHTGDNESCKRIGKI